MIEGTCGGSLVTSTHKTRFSSIQVVYSFFHACMKNNEVVAHMYRLRNRTNAVTVYNMGCIHIYIYIMYDDFITSGCGGRTKKFSGGGSLLPDVASDVLDRPAAKASANNRSKKLMIRLLYRKEEYYISFGSLYFCSACKYIFAAIYAKLMYPVSTSQ